MIAAAAAMMTQAFFFHSLLLLFLNHLLLPIFLFPFLFKSLSPWEQTFLTNEVVDLFVFLDVNPSHFFSTKHDLCSFLSAKKIHFF